VPVDTYCKLYLLSCPSPDWCQFECEMEVTSGVMGLWIHASLQHNPHMSGREISHLWKPGLPNCFNISLHYVQYHYTPTHTPTPTPTHPHTHTHPHTRMSGVRPEKCTHLHIPKYSRVVPLLIVSSFVIRSYWYPPNTTSSTSVGLRLWKPREKLQRGWPTTGGSFTCHESIEGKESRRKSKGKTVKEKKTNITVRWVPEWMCMHYCWPTGFHIRLLTSRIQASGASPTLLYTVPQSMNSLGWRWPESGSVGPLWGCKWGLPFKAPCVVE